MDRRRRIVRGYLSSITDDRKRMVCFLLMRETPQKTICRTLHIDCETLEAVKLQIAIDLRQAGIRFGGEEN